MLDYIPFNKPFMTGFEIENIKQAYDNGALAGDGAFTKRCSSILEGITCAPKVLLTHSCTAALEMAAFLINVKPGDEIILPSYTFVSTANAFVLRGGVPVFVDIRADTLNIDETLIEDAITPKTRAIVPVHYAGVSCDMEVILRVAKKYGLVVVEDAAQAFMSSYKGKPLGSMGDLGTLSFHETKNVISGEGGALIVSNRDFVQRAEIIREKGTDRSLFFSGAVDKYTWRDFGSSFLPGELVAAFLLAQLESAEAITNARLQIWGFYHELIAPLEAAGLLRRPRIPDGCVHNAHMYYVLLSDGSRRESVISSLRDRGIAAVFHYVPLHDSPAGRRFGRTHGTLHRTEELSGCLLRLPLWIGLNPANQSRIVEALTTAIA